MAGEGDIACAVTLSTRRLVVNFQSIAHDTSKASDSTPLVFAMVSTRASAFYSEKAVESFLSKTSLRQNDRFLLIANEPESVLFSVPSSIEIIQNALPLSFAENVNQAISAADQQEAGLVFLNNDVLFTSGWLGPVIARDDVIAIPYCNQHKHYSIRGAGFNSSLDWEDFNNRFDLLEEIASLNSLSMASSTHVTRQHMAFFIFYLSRNVRRILGRFDVAYGLGGAEDVDYRLRALLAGLDVVFATESYVLHFEGKSTWRGAETRDETEKRNAKYRRAFTSRWGARLAALFVGGVGWDDVPKEREVKKLLDEGRFTELIKYCLEKENIVLPTVLIR